MNEIGYGLVSLAALVAVVGLGAWVVQRIRGRSTPPGWLLLPVMAFLVVFAALTILSLPFEFAGDHRESV